MQHEYAWDQSRSFMNIFLRRRASWDTVRLSPVASVNWRVVEGQQRKKNESRQGRGQAPRSPRDLNPKP